MSVDQGPLIQALIVYQTSMDDEFDIDLLEATSNRGPKPIEELVKFQLRLKTG